MTVPTYESFAVKKQNTNQICLTVPYLVGDLQLPFKNKKGYLYALLLSIMSRNLRSKNEVLFVEDGRSQRMRERERERGRVCVEGIECQDCLFVSDIYNRKIER